MISSKKIKIKSYRSSHNKNSKIITSILKATLVEFGINRARYYGGDLEGTSNVWFFQNLEKIFKQLSIEINKIIINETPKKEVNDYTEMYIEIYTMFDSLFSLSRTLCDKISQEIVKS